ncbi:MAG TPA: hypothetical protein VMM15_14785 [Bradyrhizobium sp.]|nr:hypothetical protein [Bradyrhizobium sp.]
MATVLVLIRLSMRFRLPTPTAILLSVNEPFNQNGSGEINCATEKRRRSAAFEAKSGNALRAGAVFSATFPRAIQQ